MITLRFDLLEKCVSTVSYQCNCERRYYYKNDIVLFYFVQLSFNGYSKTMIDLHLIAVTYITRMQNHDQKILLAKTYGVENICDYAAI